MDDCRKRQTSTATPAEPGDLPWGVAPAPAIPPRQPFLPGPHDLTGVPAYALAIHVSTRVSAAAREMRRAGVRH